MIGDLIKSSRQFWKDFRERAVNTFWQGAVPTLIAAQPTTDWSALKSIGIAACVGGAASLLSMAKSLIFKNRGVKNSASANKVV